jgi:hypothetical protein
VYALPSKQVVIIGRRTFPITNGISGPTITGVFTPEQKRYITRVYGVQIMELPVSSKSPHKRK